MSFLKTALLVAIAAYTVHYVYQKLYPTQIVITSGTTSEEFKEIEKVFRSNFESAWEKQGASFVVYKDGKKVVDLWGGYADKEAEKLWKEDTMAITFSSTKGIAALCLAMLVDRGRLRYDDLVSKHWPEFANNGKANVTIQMVMSHEAGLIYLDDLTFEHAKNPISIGKLFEDQKPHWPPGTDTRYHAVTYGWLVDQIVRRTDEKERGVGQFLREEVTGPNDIDYHIGLPMSEAHRVARIGPVSLWDILSEGITDPQMFPMFASFIKLQSNPQFSKSMTAFEFLFDSRVNNADNFVLEQAAALGIGNARSMAQLYNLFVTEKLVSAKTLDKLQNAHTTKADGLTKMSVAKGHGLMYFPLNRAGSPFLIGHPGYGCQQAFYDSKNKVVISYTSNAMKIGREGVCRTYTKLESAVYEVIEKMI